MKSGLHFQRSDKTVGISSELEGLKLYQSSLRNPSKHTQDMVVVE